jgi:hypothetical protein
MSAGDAEDRFADEASRWGEMSKYEVTPLPNDVASSLGAVSMIYRGADVLVGCAITEAWISDRTRCFRCLCGVLASGYKAESAYYVYNEDGMP